MISTNCCISALIPAAIIGIIILFIRGLIAFIKFGFSLAGILIIVTIVWYFTQGRRNGKS